MHFYFFAIIGGVVIERGLLSFAGLAFDNHFYLYVHVQYVFMSCGRYDAENFLITFSCWLSLYVAVW